MLTLGIYQKYDPLQDGISCVELIDSMGNDGSIVKAARVSTGKDNQEPDEEKDSKLIKYLLVNKHWSPFECCYVTFHVALPIFVARQWIRHKSWSFSEISRRYTSENIQFYFPSIWQGQDSKNKQSSTTALSKNTCDYASKLLKASVNQAYETYNMLIDRGISREEARLVLPLNLYTRWYATAPLRSVIHWHQLRADSHSQSHIQAYASAISEIMLQLFPITWRLYLEERSKATRLD